MGKRHSLIAALAIPGLFLAGCGGGQGGLAPASSTPASRATPSPSSATGLIAIAEVPTSGYNSAQTPVRLMRPDGTEADRVTIKQGVADVPRAAGSRIFVIDQNGGLKAVHRDGSVEDLGSLGSGPPNSFTVSPDGRRWMWGTFEGQTSQVHVAGDGLAARVVAEEHKDARAIMAYAWTPAGAFIVDSPVGIGGYILFNPALGPVQRVDLSSYQATPVPHTDGCAFSDMSRDGTIACFPTGGSQNSRSLSLIAANGSTKTVQLAMPRFAQDGDAYFTRDGSRLTVAGATGAGANGQPEQYGTDLVRSSDGSITRLSIAGVRPAERIQADTWLVDGSLIVYRPDGAAGGPAAVYLVGPSGNVTQLGGRGIPIGTLTG